jgi:hypothetical protein
MAQYSSAPNYSKEQAAAQGSWINELVHAFSKDEDSATSKTGVKNPNSPTPKPSANSNTPTKEQSAAIDTMLGALGEVASLPLFDNSQVPNDIMIKNYLKRQGVECTKVEENDKGYEIWYKAANGKTYAYDLNMDTTEKLSLPQLNTRLAGLLSNAGVSGSGSGSGYSSGNPNAAGNATASNAMLNAIINGTNPSVAGATSAKQNFTITAADYAALKARYPNYSDEQLTKLIAESQWAKNFGADLSDKLTTSALEGATLEEFEATAKDNNNAAKTMTDATIAQQREALLKEIANDPALYEAVIKQLRTDAASGTVAGQHAANALAAAREGNDSYRSAADTLYSEIGGTGEESAAGKLRSTIYNSLLGAYSGYTDQQLNKFNTDMLLQAGDTEELKTALSLIAQGLNSEDAQVKRAAEAEAIRIANEARDRESKAAQESSSSIANANASAEDVTTLSTLAGQVASTSGNASDAAGAAKHKHSSYGTGTYNKPEYTDAPYIDESLYQTLLTDAYLKFLTPDVYTNFTQRKSEADMAEQYGLTDLLDVDRVVNQFTNFQQQANAESDRVFNDAQRAYIMAIAAGDARTAEQLTRLAQTTNTGRKNLYGASALANQFAQQRANASVGDTLYYDSVRQQALNDSSVANAAQAGRQQWNTWVGNGNSNASQGGFNAAYNQHVTNTNNATTYYGDLLRGAMLNQSNYNDTVGTLTNDRNTTLSQYAASLNNLNAQGAATNTSNSALIAGVKNNAEVQKLINQSIK